MKKSRVFYEAILAAKPPTELGLAIRDGLPFDKLKDESIAAIALTASLYERGLAKLVEELAKVPDPAAPNGETPAPADAPTVAPATQKKAAATSGKAEKSA